MSTYDDDEMILNWDVRRGGRSQMFDTEVLVRRVH
jgi:hypothetical protein